LPVESGRHTDPTTGISYRTFAVWKPEAAHAAYIHDDELNEKYKAAHLNGRVAGGLISIPASQRLKLSKRTSSAGQSFRFGSA